MYLYVNKKTKEVKMISQKKQKVDETIFDVVRKTGENYEDYKRGNGCSMKYDNGKIEKTKIDQTEEKFIERKENLENIDKAKTVDELKEIIKQLI